MDIRPQIDARYLLNLCRSLKDIFPDYSKGSEFHLKSVDNPVTETDLKLDQAIYKTLTGDGFLSEEIVCEERLLPKSIVSDSVWIIDPLDGTKEFIQGLPEFAVSIAFMKNKKFEAAAVYNPAASFLALCDSKGVSSPILTEGLSLSNLNSDALLCSRSEWNRGLLQNYNFKCPIVPLGSIAYKMALVAAGKAMGTVSFQPKKSWDIAAGTALILRAGGIVTDLKGRKLDFSDPLKIFSDGILATIDHGAHASVLNIL